MYSHAPKAQGVILAKMLMLVYGIFRAEGRIARYLNFPANGYFPHYVLLEKKIAI
jgi:hypothetical protein